MRLRFGWTAVLLLVSAGGLSAQAIEFESGGLRYQALSKNGVTVMFAKLPARLRDYVILQAGIMNGSPVTFTIRPEDFSFQGEDGTALNALPARTVVDQLLDRAGRNDVIKLISTYEMGLNGVVRFRSTNGYEQRRQAALAEMGSNKFKAAAAASAIAFVAIKLATGESSDGALFFQTGGKPLGAGRLISRVAGETFEFNSDPSATTKVLQQRSQPPSPK